MQVNKIYNEDCLVGLKKIPDNSIDLVVIDPPYDICTKGGKKGTGRLCHDLTKLENELKESNLVNGYDLSILDELIRVMKEIGLDSKDTDKVVSIGGGGFIRKTDAKRFGDMWDTLRKEYNDLIKADKTAEGYIKDMFVSEL